MNVVFIDDEIGTNYENTFRLMSMYYGANNVTFFDGVDEALCFLEKEAANIDLVFIDQYIGGSNMNGLELGEVIIEKYPHIASIMLTGVPSLELCQKAMRLGFCDFLCKPDLTGSDIINHELERIEKLPSFEAKQKFKDIESRITHLLHNLNKERKDDYILNFKNCIVRDRAEGILETIESRLDKQEFILELANKALPRIRINMYNLSGSIMLLEKGKNVDVDILNDLFDLNNHQKYGLNDKGNSNSYSTLKGYFKMCEKGQYTNVTLIVFGLLANQETRFKTTLAASRRKRDNRFRRDFCTMIDDIVLEL